jgi:saccharopine dehydrogenase (NAD+, L-lysine-forming)
MTQWMLYGANGYTGRLIARLAAERSSNVILAGRNRDAIETMGRELELPTRIFELSEMEHHLGGVSAVLLTAGPFVRTSAVAVAACLSKGVHYLDITGEIDVYQALHGLGPHARRAGSVLLPGVGFDVVPSDCLAATLAAALPSATHLELAFSGGQVSKGTLKTMITHLGAGGAIRENGIIKPVPLGWREKDIPFHDKTRHCVTIPWGDVATAYFSTGIPNIRVYTGASASRVRQMKLMGRVAPVLSLPPVERLLERVVDARVSGPDEQARGSRQTELWGRAHDADGRSVSATLTTPEGYTLTARCALAAVERVGDLDAGYYTPSMAFGADFITEFEGCTLRSPQ